MIPDIKSVSSIYWVIRKRYEDCWVKKQTLEHPLLYQVKNRDLVFRENRKIIRKQFSQAIFLKMMYLEKLPKAVQ